MSSIEMVFLPVPIWRDFGKIYLKVCANISSDIWKNTIFPTVFLMIPKIDGIVRAKEAILSIIRARHEGEDDITVITQDAVLATFDRIFRALTMTVGGIAAISLVVAGIMIMNIMLVAVSNRRAEIGLLKALGSPRRQIMGLFLTESALLSIAGAAIGFFLAYGVMEILARLFSEYSLALAPWSPFIASSLALGTGSVSLFEMMKVAILIQQKQKETSGTFILAKKLL